MFDETAAAASFTSFPLNALMLDARAGKSKPIFDRNSAVVQAMKKVGRYRDIGSEIRDLSSVGDHAKEDGSWLRSGAGTGERFAAQADPPRSGSLDASRGRPASSICREALEAGTSLRESCGSFSSRL